MRDSHLESLQGLVVLERQNIAMLRALLEHYKNILAKKICPRNEELQLSIRIIELERRINGERFLLNRHEIALKKRAIELGIID